MGWLVRRAFVVWLILVVICAGVVGIVRVNGGQDRLQAMGFGVCDGEPCWQGIRVGMDWEEAERLGHDAVQIRPRMYFGFSTVTESINVQIDPTENGKSVLGIALEVSSIAPQLSITTADIIRLFGSPCLIAMYDDFPDIQYSMFIYPQLQAGFYLRSSRLQLDSPVGWVTISKPTEPNACMDRKRDQNSSWRGFTTVQIYSARNRRALGLTPTP
jgi:hypothetical protein